ncbi:MAG: hypothetical protein F9K23_14155 [Bacteroidetes bacterium]|nr:MAG: hypothetical protein F9K23_14155 [Bacteroidota bacterium]
MSIIQLYGNVNKDGSIKSGSGFTIKHDPGKPGYYTVVFNHKFSSMPSATAIQNYIDWPEFNFTGGSTLDNVVLVAIDTGNAVFKTGDNTGNGQNRNFSFIIMGPA